ncbi:HCP-like protein [Auriscalpium vulgare]|uniref:HCP-like protein n=1 Tax=Auriscalpium vulgare TaxID=40419 RepID=A0ACB8RBV7_9AGAM|nr:HCP-like protein [Auriscalpium vulgare]
MGRGQGVCRRRATWLAFGLLALAAVSGTAQHMPDDSHEELGDFTAEAAAATTSYAPSASSASELHHGGKDPRLDPDTVNEAARAYKQAVATLGTLTALPPSHTPDPPLNPSWTLGNSFISSLLPNVQGQGPLGSALRIAIKLRHHTWLPHFLTSRVGSEGLRRRRDEELLGRAIKVVDLLQHAADLGNTDALFTLGQISLLPPTLHFNSDPVLAYNSFETHAAITGNATSQSYLAFFYATGYHDVVRVNQAKAQLYFTFAAHGGHKGAQMALGYRFWTGIGVVENCDLAVEWYSNAAEQAMARFLSGPPGGRTLPQTSTRLSDLSGGVYGPGASVASTGLNAQRPAIKAARARAAGETWEDILEYYIFNADRGETDFAYRLGKIFYQGSIYSAPGGISSGGEGVGRVPRDFAGARFYFERIARQGWPQDPIDPLSHTPRRDEPPKPMGHAALAAGYLGRMYLRGEGVRQDFKLARMWFERGAEYGDKESNNGLGIIWRDGLVDNRRDMKKALGYFNIAAGQELAEAQVNLGKYHYEKNELKLATTYFETAMRHGSPFEAYYYLAQIQAQQMRLLPASLRPGACSIAASFYKVVAERGTWDDDLISSGERSWETETRAGKELAMLKWWIAAERGHEVAQNNLAFVLDQDKSVLRDTRFTSFSPSNDTARLALTQWTRSAAQNNVDALVKVGDYYYHGLGVADEPEHVRWEKAAGYYQSAADTQVSALAMWNLGWMYENGIGVNQDFHLAKRHYDVALETNLEAYLPITLSLFRLYCRSLYHALRGDRGDLNIWSSVDDADVTTSVTDGRRELDDGQAHGATDRPAEEVVEEDDGPWYLGKARDEFNRRRQAPAVAADEEDPVQWARERRNAENERDSDFGPEDYFEAALRGGHRGEEDADEFVETMVLVVLCLVVSLLLYIRGRWVERLRREERQLRQQQEQQQQQVHDPANPQPVPPPQQDGMFPPQGDPARDAWAVIR